MAKLNREFPLAPSPDPGDFGSAFKNARKSGEKNFFYKGKKYSTETAEDIARRQTPEQNLVSARKAEIEAQKKGFKNKALNNIQDSYSKVYGEQMMKKYNMKKP